MSGKLRHTQDRRSAYDKGSVDQHTYCDKKTGARHRRLEAAKLPYEQGVCVSAPANGDARRAAACCLCELR